MNADDEITALMISAGYTLKRWSGHYIWVCPCGQHQSVTGRSSSDRRSIRNARGIIRRQHPERLTPC